MEPTIVDKKGNFTRFRCECCNGEWTVYRIYFSKNHVRILEKVFLYCVHNRTHIIDKKKIPWLTPSEYTNFSHLQRFWLIYWLEDENWWKQRSGKWWVAVWRIRKLLDGQWKVAEYTQKDTRTWQQQASDSRIFVHEAKRYRKEYEKSYPEWLPYFVSFDTDPFDNHISYPV